MPPAGVRVLGETGQPILLLPGGAEECGGFFPGLIEGLVADPGCRVIVHDRPGAGSSTETGSLGGSASHLKALVDELGCGPVVVVGHSRGGGVATLRVTTPRSSRLWSCSTPPRPTTPAAARLERAMRLLEKMTAVPALGRLLSAGLRASFARQRRRQHLRPDCEAAHARIGDLDIAKPARSVHGITELSAGTRQSHLPGRIPAVVVTNRAG